MGMETLTQFDEILRLIYKNWYICRYELPINLQNFMQKELTEVKIFLKVLGGYFFFETPCIHTCAIAELQRKLMVLYESNDSVSNFLCASRKRSTL